MRERGSAHSLGRSSGSGSGSGGCCSSGGRRRAGLRSRTRGLGLNHFTLDSRRRPRGLDRDGRLQPGHEEEEKGEEKGEERGRRQNS